MDLFTLFKEPRPLGANPFPLNTPCWEKFEVFTAQTKEKLDTLWAGYQESYNRSTPIPERLKLILDARFRRLDIITGQMLKACPPVDEVIAAAYEEWLENLMRSEQRDVLELIDEKPPNEPVPSRRMYFDESEYARLLIFKHQEYKKTFDSDRRRVLEGAQAHSAPADSAIAAPLFDWDKIIITFLSDFTVRVATPEQNKASCNYAEMGFEDLRRGGGKPVKAWEMLRDIASEQRHRWDKKTAQDLKKRLKAYFHIDSDPLVWNRNTGYTPRFQLRVSPSFGGHGEISPL
ncbi:MAG TPA: hypothetical protein VMB85_02265 [Bryobacteraceae bacterium]|nr:hypothetical protein [Bryobacteraceae bacterium]